MSLSTVVASVFVGLGAGYTMDKYLKNKKMASKKTEYNTFEFGSGYEYDGPLRIYKYSVRNASVENMKKKYAESLYGNGDVKKSVDDMLTDYLSNNKIEQKRVVIQTKGWVSDFDIEENVKDKTLVFISRDNLQ